ncbi:MAG: hypothetical protein IPG71_06965 [bacterium]|nr:hypothetical protein [bacterium]
MASRERDYLTRDYGRFAVTYCPEDSHFVDGLVRTLEQRLPNVCNRLGIHAPDSARFVITPSREEWRRVTAGSPLWANGVAYPERGVAVLKSPSFNVNGGPIGETAVHELVHLLLEPRSGAGFPRWLDEGLAQFMAGQQEFNDVHVLARAATSGRLLGFWDIQGLMAFDDNLARQGYAQSLVAIEDLRQRFGDAGLANLVHEVRSGRDLEQAFLTLFGMPFGQFEREHLELLRERYGSQIWSDGELWISLLFVILVLAAGAFAFQRRRRTVERWRQERLPAYSAEPRDVPYTVNYTIIRERQLGEDDQLSEGAKHDKPLPGN